MSTSKPIQNRPKLKLSQLLNPLLISNGPWSSIEIDFVLGLPVDEEFDSILVFVDRFTKRTHLVPAKKSFRASDFARVFICKVY